MYATEVLDINNCLIKLVAFKNSLLIGVMGHGDNQVISVKYRSDQSLNKTELKNKKFTRYFHECGDDNQRF